MLTFGLGAFLLLPAGCSRPDPPPNPPLASLDRPLSSLIETSRQAVLATPKSADAWGRLGQAFHAVEFFGEARICYSNAAELDSLAPRWPHLLGLLQLQEHPDAAFGNLARAAELTGAQPDAPRVLLAKAMVERGRFDDAAKPLQVLLAANPAHAAARLEMARVWIFRDELKHAAESLAPCTTNPVTARAAMLLLAQILQRQGNAEAAGGLSRRAASMPRPFDWPDPWLREVQSLRVDRQKLADHVNGLLMQQRLSQAGAELEKLLNIFPDDAEALLLLGRLLSLEQKQTEAEAAFRRHLATQPSSLNGLVQLGISLLRQERWADAAAALRRALALKPDFAQAHYNLGYALSRAGDSAGAVASYKEALRCAPGEVGTHMALAEELQRAGLATEALEHVNRAAELSPEDPRVRQMRERLEK